MKNLLPTLLSVALSMIFFDYRCGNRLLIWLHNNKEFFLYTVLIYIVILFASPRLLIVVDIIEIILIAAILYTNKIVSDNLGRRKGAPIVLKYGTLKKRHKNRHNNPHANQHKIHHIVMLISMWISIRKSLI